MKNIVKQCRPYLGAIIVFMVISVGYFTPSIFEGKTLYQTDIRKGAGMGQDLNKHKQETGEKSLWSSRMFSGMPAYQISPSYASSSVLIKMRRTFEGWLPAPASYLFALMLGFFMLLLAFKIKPWIAVIGAIAYAFSSYFLIIIAAGHIWKVFVLQLIPPTLAGIVWAYRGRYLLGGIVTALFFALQLVSNHLQMTYYFLLFVAVFVIGRLFYDYKQKQLMQFAKATAILIIAGLIGFGANATNMVFTQKYTEQTIRGKSELTDNEGNKTSGLDRDYVTDWSYGIGETFTLLIPNTKGGASGSMWENHQKAVQKSTSDRNLQGFVANLNSYWGDQPFTSGPTYVGAFILCLFVFGLFVVKGYLKWTLLIGTVLSILLSWGHNFMWLTNLFLDYVPFYNKMRTVASILVIAELTIPLLAIIILMKIVENRRLIFEQKKAFYISLSLTAGIAFLFVVFPRLFFNFTSNTESAAFAQYTSDPAYVTAFNTLEDARVSAFCADAWRSIFIILLGASFIWLYSAKKIKPALFITLLAALVLFDLAGVNKRYLNSKNFVSKARARVAWELTDADGIILEDRDPNYRVLNLAVSPFQDASTSYYHKSIGGYHAAKLRRYQELIDRHLIKMNMNVINMLNTRYFILPCEEGHSHVHEHFHVQINPDTLGCAWFVNEVQIVQNADEEIAALTDFDPRTTAVVDVRFDNQLAGFSPQRDTMAKVEMVKYKIDEIEYRTTAESEQLLVFSEIYYDDGLSRWEAFIDGQPAPHFRANYVLRALKVPAGEHTVKFVFKPRAYKVLETLSMIFLWTLLLSAVAAAGWGVKKRFYP